MKKSRILKMAIVFNQIMIAFIILMVVCLVAAVIHWYLDPKSYSLVELTQGFNAGYGIGGFKIHRIEPAQDTGKVLLNQVSSITIILLALRGVLFAVLTILIFRSITRILKSIRSVKTFYDANIANLKYTGRCMLLISILSFFNLGEWQDTWQINFSLPLGPILLTLFAYVLAEVFTEGKHLLEDKNMIV